MADDEYVAVVDIGSAMDAVHAMVEARRGYLALLEQLVSPHPIDFQYDQKKRNQMMTLLSRADTLWVLMLVHLESSFADKADAKSARNKREGSLGKFLTRAAIARGLAISESGAETSEPSRRHTVAAARIVEAGLSYGLFEIAPMPDAKQQPIQGTAKLAKLLHALGDHAHWVMRSAVEGASQRSPDTYRSVREDAAAFRHEGSDQLRMDRSSRITADDAVMKWLEDEA